MHGRQEWFRYARDPLWERLNGFAALGRGIAMGKKQKSFECNFSARRALTITPWSHPDTGAWNSIVACAGWLLTNNGSSCRVWINGCGPRPRIPCRRHPGHRRLLRTCCKRPGAQAKKKKKKRSRNVSSVAGG
jgi:hypothetical protein